MLLWLFSPSVLPFTLRIRLRRLVPVRLLLVVVGGGGVGGGGVGVGGGGVGGGVGGGGGGWSKRRPHVVQAPVLRVAGDLRACPQSAKLGKTR